MLVQQEPDASSFPNGGIRNTFEARGYSAWDPTSPAFIVGGTLCIPTVFIAYTGEALDYKVPLLRSISAVNKAATEVCRYFDKEVNRVIQYLGWEQEYFLVDESLWAVRPDLMLTGRTLMGHESAKNQQLEDHYFGAIPTRVIAFMADQYVLQFQFGAFECIFGLRCLVGKAEDREFCELLPFRHAIAVLHIYLGDRFCRFEF